MNYFAETLDKLNTVSLYITVHLPSKLVFSNSVIILSSPGSVDQIINLPAKTNHEICVLGVGTHKLKLPIFSPTAVLDDSIKTNLNTVYAPQLSSNPCLKWKELPSEYWAELMDMWHCHKPHEGMANDTGMYELAASGFHPKPGLAYFSRTYFLIHRDDLKSPDHRGSILRDSETTVKIMLWDLDVDKVSRVIGIMLAELIDAHATYKFLVNSEIIVWVLNTNTSYTLRNQPIRAGVRVLYQITTTSAPPVTTNLEPIDLPLEVYRKFVKELTEFNEKVPQNIKTLGNWHTAIL